MLFFCFVIGWQRCVTARWCPICRRRPSGAPPTCPAVTRQASPNSTGETVRNRLCCCELKTGGCCVYCGFYLITIVWLFFADCKMCCKEKFCFLLLSISLCPPWPWGDQAFVFVGVCISRSTVSIRLIIVAHMYDCTLKDLPWLWWITTFEKPFFYWLLSLESMVGVAVAASICPQTNLLVVMRQSLTSSELRITYPPTAHPNESFSQSHGHFMSSPSLKAIFPFKWCQLAENFQEISWLCVLLWYECHL